MQLITFAISLISLLLSPPDAKVTDLKDGYSRVETASYVIEVPTGWEVSRETPWGQRKAAPKGESGELGVMTAPPAAQTWDQLYQTSLYFIQREGRGRATPYRLSKTTRGLEAASFEVLDNEGFPNRRYVLIRDERKGLIALSVKVPSKQADKQWSKHFDRLIKSAHFKD